MNDKPAKTLYGMGRLGASTRWSTMVGRSFFFPSENSILTVAVRGVEW